MKIKLLAVMIIATGIACVIAMASYLNHSTYLALIPESVSGLRVGAPVEFNGVIAGKVSSIKINKNNPGFVKVWINVDKDTPVTAGTVATLAFAENKSKPFIALKDEGKNLNALVRKDNESYKVISGVVSNQTITNDSLDVIAKNLKQFNDTFQLFMSPDNVESFKQLLYSMQTVLGMLSENNDRMRNLLVNTEKASYQFQSFLTITQKTMRTLDNETLPATYQLVNNLEEIMNKVNLMVSDISQDPSVLLRGKAAPVPGPGER